MTRSTRSPPFNRDNGEEILGRHFAKVERVDVDGWVTFSDAEAIRRYIRSLITEGDKAERVPDNLGPVRAGTRVTVFVATETGAVPPAAGAALC